MAKNLNQFNLKDSGGTGNLGDTINKKKSGRKENLPDLTTSFANALTQGADSLTKPTVPQRQNQNSTAIYQGAKKAIGTVGNAIDKVTAQYTPVATSSLVGSNATPEKKAAAEAGSRYRSAVARSGMVGGMANALETAQDIANMTKPVQAAEQTRTSNREMLSRGYEPETTYKNFATDAITSGVKQLTKWSYDQGYTDQFIQALEPAKNSLNAKAEEITNQGNEYAQMLTPFKRNTAELLANVEQNVIRDGIAMATGNALGAGAGIMSDLMMGLPAYGEALKSAKEQGLEGNKARQYALLQAGIEVGSEHMFDIGGVNGYSLGLENAIADAIDNTTMRPGAKYIMHQVASVLTEGGEEFFASLARDATDRQMLGQEKGLGQSLEDAGSAFLQGAMSALLLSGIRGNFTESGYNQYKADLAVRYLSMSDYDKTSAVNRIAEVYNVDPAMLEREIDTQSREAIKGIDPDVLYRALNHVPVAVLNNGESVYDYVGQVDQDKKNAMKMAERLGDAYLVEDLGDDEHNRPVAGVTLPDGKILVSARAEDPVSWVMAHEGLHQARGKKGWNDFVNDANLRMRDVMGESFQNWFDNLNANYAKFYANVAAPDASLTDTRDYYVEEGRKLYETDPSFREKMDEEVAAYYVQKNLLHSDESMRRFLNSTGNVAQKVYQALRDTVSGFGKTLTDEEKTLADMEKRFGNLIRENEVEARNGIGVADDGSVFQERYSRATWEALGEEGQKSLAHDVAKSIGVTDEEAENWLKDINSVSATIGDAETYLDYEPNRAYSALKKDSDYIYTVDMSTLCKKRILLSNTIQEIQRLLPNVVLTGDDYIRIRQMMKGKGYEVACGFCYVESRRKFLDTVAQQFIDVMSGKQTEKAPNKRQVMLTDELRGKDNYIPNLYDLTTPTGSAILMETHPDVYNTFVSFNNARGQNRVKLVETRTEYNGEIRNISDGDFDKIQRLGGLRLQSYSDFETPHLIDMMQVVADMSARGFKSQAYTKVPNFADAFGKTGVKINESLVVIGVDENGQLIFDDVEGMPHELAFALRNKYSENVGTVIVGKDDATIMAAFADPRIDYIIPFHSSGWKNEEYQNLGINGYKDYTKVQTERDIISGKSVDEHIYPADYWDYSVSGDENAKRYLRLCEGLGRIPKFDNFLTKDDAGHWVAPSGYWKTLIDFKMYDNDGVGVPQRVVTPTFDDAVNQRILDEYVNEQSNGDPYSPKMDIVNEFIREKGYGERYSLSDETEEDPTYYKDLRFDTVADREEFEKNHPTYLSAKELSEIDDWELYDEREAEREAALRDFDAYEKPRLRRATVRELFEHPERFSHNDLERFYDEFTPNGLSDFYDDPTSIPVQDIVRDTIEAFQSDEGYAEDWDNFLDSKFLARLAPGSTEEEVNQVVNEHANAIRPQSTEDVPTDDETYMAAVMNGDTELQQQIIDARAREQGYDTPHLYHGTPTGGFTEFDPSRSNQAYRQRFGQGMYFTDRQDVAEHYTRNRDFLPEDETNPMIYDVYLNSPDRVVQDVRDGSPLISDVYVAQTPNQIKSAEPITYDDEGNIIPPSQRFNPEVADIRYSIAVQDGDVEEQNRLVEEAAMNAFPNSWLNYDGKFSKVWHFTNNEFNSFLPGINPDPNGIKGIYFARSDKGSLTSRLGNGRPYYINITNPAVSGTRNGGQYFNLLQERQKGVTDRNELAQINKQFMDETGIDSFVDHVTGWITVLSPEQIKSADPVTYDNNGNVIPLSERFNPDNPDLRYSLNDEYMDAVNRNDMDEADSLLRQWAEEQGYDTNKPVYHGTPRFGWTEYKDNQHEVPFIYTSDNPTVAAHYAGDNNYAFRRNLGKAYSGASDLNSIIQDAKSVWNTDYRVMTDQDRQDAISEVFVKYIDDARDKLLELETDEVNLPTTGNEEEDIRLANVVAWIPNAIWTAEGFRDDITNLQNFDRDYWQQYSDSLTEDYEMYEKDLPLLREYYSEHLNELNDATKKYLQYLLGYDLGDAVIYTTRIAKALSDKDMLINETGNISDPEAVRDSLDKIHNIGAYTFYGNYGNNPYRMDANGSQFWAIPNPDMGEGYHDTDSISKWASDNDYTSILMDNIYDYGDKAQNNVFFDPSQIKLADTVTYDDNGDIIPLNQRFNLDNPDIRYAFGEQYPSWQDVPEQEGNWGYHAGDLGKAEPRGSQGYYRGTGHFGTGTYFVGNPSELRYGSYKNRPVESVDFSQYNLLTLDNADDAYKLHDFLKAIDGQMFPGGNSTDPDLNSTVYDVARILRTSPGRVRTLAGYVSDLNLDRDKTFTDDSLATRFMKSLGYEGVDTRNIPDFDNTRYGSVIYDLKGNDLERKQANGARFSLNEEIPEQANAFPDRNYPQDRSAMRTLGQISRERVAADPLTYESISPESFPVPDRIQDYLDLIEDEEDRKYGFDEAPEKELSEEDKDMYQSIQGNKSGALQGFATPTQMFNNMVGKTGEQREFLRDRYERPMYETKKEYNTNREQRWTALENMMKETGIQANTPESAAVQWYGEKVKPNEQGETVPYTLNDLKREFPNKWEDIVKMEQFMRGMYDEYVGRINAALEQVYPNLEEKAQAQLESWRNKIRVYQDEIEMSRNPVANEYWQNEIAKLDKKIAKLEEDLESGEYFRNKRLNPRQDYFHHFQEVETKGIGGLKNILQASTLIDPQLVGKTEFTKPKSRWMSWLQKRGQGAYTADAVLGMGKYIDTAEYAIAFDPLIAQYRDEISNMVKATRDTKNANQLIQYLSAYTNQLAGKTASLDRTVLDLLGEGNRGQLFNALAALNNRAKSNAVVGNVRSAVSQLFNIPNALSIIKSNTAWAKGARDYAESILGHNRELLDQSPFLQERYFDHNVDDLKARNTTKEKLIGKAGDVTNWMMEIGDKVATEIIWLSAYNEGIEKGVSDPIYYADDLTRQSVAGRGVGEVPYNMKSRVASFFMPFQVETNNQWQNMKSMFKDKDARGILRLMLGSYMMNALIAKPLFNDGVLPDIVDALIQGLKKLFDKDREESAGEVLLDTAKRAAGEAVSFIPGTSLWLPAIMSSDSAQALFGDSDPTRYGTGTVGLSTITKTLADAVDGDDQFDLMSPLLQLGLPYGGKQISRLYNTLQDFNVLPSNGVMNTPFGGESNPATGDYSKAGNLKYRLPDEVNSGQDAMEIARAFLFGPNATDAAEEYFESGKPALTKERVERYKEYSDVVDVDDYIQYLKEANTDGKSGISQAEAYRWLSQNEDLSDEEKNALWDMTSNSWKKSYDEYTPQNEKLVNEADEDGDGRVTQAEAYDWLSKQDDMSDAEKAILWSQNGWKKAYDEYARSEQKKAAAAELGYDLKTLTEVADSDSSGSLRQSELYSWLQDQDLTDAEKSSLWDLGGWKTDYNAYSAKQKGSSSQTSSTSSTATSKGKSNLASSNTTAEKTTSGTTKSNLSSSDDMTKPRNASGITNRKELLIAADTNNDGYMSQKEAYAYLSGTNLSEEEKEALWNLSNWKTSYTKYAKKNG